MLSAVEKYITLTVKYILKKINFELHYNLQNAS